MKPSEDRVRRRAVVVLPSIAVVAFGLVTFQLRGWAQAQGPVTIPKEGEGYQLTRTDSSKKAPSGFEGRTDTSTQTAVGNTPATMGKRVVSHFTLSNQIKTCPLADSEAYGVGTALAYWAGVYYSVAQLQWRGGQCVKISFSPPSNTVQPALGAQAKVKADVKTKSGERVPAKFFDAHAFHGGNVSPVQGMSTETSPLTFT